VAADEMVSNFFSVDFQTLEEGERATLEEVAREGKLTRRAIALAAGRSEDAMEPQIYGLVMLGYLTSDGHDYRLGNWFFERWLRRVAAARTGARPLQ
jgi:hypothetical protein